MPVLIFIAFLDLERKSSFLDRRFLVFGAGFRVKKKSHPARICPW